MVATGLGIGQGIGCGHASSRGVGPCWVEQDYRGSTVTELNNLITVERKQNIVHVIQDRRNRTRVRKEQIYRVQEIDTRTPQEWSSRFIWIEVMCQIENACGI